MALQSSQRLPELHSTWRSPTGFFSFNSTWVPTYVYINPENSPSRIQFYIQKTESSSNTTTTLQRPSKGIPDIPVTHNIPASPGNSTSSSILQLECIFYKQFQFDWFPQKLHRVPVGQYKLQTLHSSKKGRCCDNGQIDIFSRIELFPSIVLSSEKTNCKNDIQ